MNLHLCIGMVTEAENVLPGDMVLTGDAGLGIASFRPVDVVIQEGDDVTLYMEGRQQHMTVKATTEVVRLEQGNNPFSDGIGGIRTRSADLN